MKMPIKTYLAWALVALGLALWTGAAGAASRIKDLADVEGSREIS